MVQMSSTANRRKQPFCSLNHHRLLLSLLLLGAMLVVALMTLLIPTVVLTPPTPANKGLITSEVIPKSDGNRDEVISHSSSSISSNDRTTKQQPPPPTTTTIAYAVSITGCGSDPITEGGAVLQHSIHRASIHGGGGDSGGDSNSNGGRYDYKMFAIYHPDAASCALPLAAVGYELLERNVFVDIATDIEGQYLREKIHENGCCGEKELIKLEAYTLTDYPIVVHLDLDVLVLKPLDDLFDLMLHGPDAVDSKDFVMWPHNELPDTINAFYTVDYNMVKPQKPFKPVQGGFLVTRPDMAVYEEFRSIVKKGDFREGSGWGGKVGPFYGSMTFQGIMPYYYNVLHPGEAVELNRCIYNQMCDNPRTGKTKNDAVSGECRTNEEECEDCRERPIEDIVTTHYTVCQKPWWCLSHGQDRLQHRLCRKLTHEWYKVRSELEKSWGRSGKGPGHYETDVFFGYCESGGKKGYIPITKPYGEIEH